MALPFDDVSTQKVRGAFQFDAGSIKDARAVTVQETRVMGSNFKQLAQQVKQTEAQIQKSSGIVGAIAGRFRTASDYAKQFGKTDLGVISGGLKKISEQTAIISATFGAMSAGGIATSLSLKKTEVAMNALAGSAKEAQKIMDTTRKIADDFKLPYVDLLEGAKELIPVSKRTNVEMDRLLLTMTKLKFAVPDKNFSQLRFSFSELLSGDKTSAQDILSILGSRSDFTKIAALAKENDVAGALDLLDELIAKANITDENMRAIGETGVNAFDNLGSAIKEAADSGFRPLLDNYILPAAQGFADFLNEVRKSHPEVLQLAASGAILITTISPLTFVLSKVVAGFALMKTAGLAAATAISGGFKNAVSVLKDLPGLIKANSTSLSGAAGSMSKAGMLTKVGVTGAALAGGVVLGGQATSFLAHTAKVQGGDFDRIRKGEDPLAIAGERFKQVIVIFVAGLLELGRGIAKVAAFILNAFDQVINVIKLGASLIRESWLRTIEAFGNVLSAIGDLLARIPGQENNALRDIGAGVAADANTQLTNLLIERGQLIDRLREGFALPQETTDSIDATFDQLGASVIGGLNNFFFPKAERAGEMVQQQLGRLGDEIMDGAETMFSEDMIEAWGDFQDELKDIEADAQKEREEELAKHETEKTKLEKEQQQKRTEAIDDFNRKQTERQTKLGWDISDLQAEFDKREKEERKKFRREELKRQADHALNLLKAVARLDGRAIYLEQQKFKQESKEREAEGKRQKNERQRQLEDRIAQMQLEFQRESELQYNNFHNVELPRLEAQQAEERAAFEAAHQERLTQITTQAAEQSAKAEEAFIDTFNKILEQEGTHQDMMLQTQREGQAQMEAELKAWWEKQAALIGTTATTTNKSKMDTYGGGYPGGNPYAPNTPTIPVPNAPGTADNPIPLPFGDRVPISGLSLQNQEAARLARMAVNGGSTAAAAATLNTRPAENAPKGGDTIIQSLTIPITFSGDIIRNPSDRKRFKDEMRGVVFEVIEEAGGKKRS